MMKQSPNQTSLAQIADIRSGFTFRGKIDEVPSGNAHVIQIKDIRKYQDGTNSDLIKSEELPRIHWDGRANALVMPNTVLLPARGGYFRAAYTGADSSALPIIASSQFILIRPKSDKVTAEFICWSLNQPRLQRYLEDIASQGSSIPMLSTAAARALKLDIPSLATQHKILDLNRIWAQEQQFTRDLLNNRERMLQGMFLQLLKEKN